MKTAFAAAMSWMPARAPFVVFYHRVVERLDASNGLALPAMEITVAMLEKQLDWLARHFEIVSVNDVTRTAGSKPLAAVTFDDGYSDVFHHAFPLLQRKGIPAAFFVVTDLIGSTQLPLHERLHALLVRAGSTDAFAETQSILRRLPNSDVQRVVARLEREHDIEGTWQEELRPMTWDMLATMRDAGMTIGSHTKSHAVLTNEAELTAELAESRELLRTDCLAYPGGAFDSRVVNATAAAGYKLAFTTCTHRDARHPSLTIPRTGLWERSSIDHTGRFSPTIMSCHAAGAFRWAARCAQRHSTSQRTAA